MTPVRLPPSRPAPPPPSKAPRPPPRAYNHYVKTSAKMSSPYREGERDIHIELEKRRAEALSPEPHLEVMRPVSPFQSRRHNPLLQQAQRQPSPTPYSQTTPYHSQSHLNLNTQSDVYPGSLRVAETSIPKSYPTNGDAGQTSYRTDESREGWGSRSRRDVEHPPAAIRRNEVWTPPSSSVEDGRSNYSHSTRETHHTRPTDHSRSSSPELIRKRDKIRRKPAPIFVPTPPQTPSTSEAPQFPPPNPNPPPVPSHVQHSQQPFHPHLVKSQTAPVPIVTTPPPRPARAATDQVPSLFRDLTRPAEAKGIPASPPSVPNPVQQTTQGSTSGWSVALVNAFKSQPALEQSERQDRERQEQLEQERAERQRRLERERAERQERLEREKAERQERHERFEREKAERQERLARLERERIERQERQERERVERERQERERAEQERQERLEREQREQQELQERLARQERIEKERLERQERLERERRERQAEKERLERLAKERLERQERAARLEREKQERAAQLERERQERERLEQERLERIQLEQVRLEHERLEQERFERERYEKERLELERRERLRIEQERQERVRREQERFEVERRELERIERERYDRERRERAEKERFEYERAEKKRLEREQELIEHERAEQERLHRERMAQQERTAREERERLEQMEKVAERERQERARQQERQLRAEQPAKVDGQPLERPERPERHDRPQRLDRDRVQRPPPVPVRHYRQDSLQPQSQDQSSSSHQPSPVAQPASLPQHHVRDQEPTIIDPKPLSRPDSEEYVVVTQKRDPRLPISIQPPPVAYTVNHVTHTGAVESIPRLPLPAEVRNEVEVQRPAIAQPQPKKVRSFTQLAAMVRPSRSPSPLVTQQPIGITAPKAITALRAHEQEQPSLSFTRSVASSWKNSRSPSPFVPSSDSVPSSPPKFDMMFPAQQVALPASKGSSAKSSRVPSPRVPSPHNTQDDVLPFGQTLHLQFFSDPTGRSASPNLQPQPLPGEATLRPRMNVREQTTQAEERSMPECEAVSSVTSIPQYPSLRDAAKDIPRVAPQLDEAEAPQDQVRPRTPPKPVIPQYAPPPPPITPAPPSTPVRDPKSATTSTSQARAQLVSSTQPEYAATEDRFSQPKMALLDQRVAGILDRTIPGPVEEGRKVIPPLQSGLVTPPETPPSSFRENPQERRSKRKSVPPTHDDIIRGPLSTGKMYGPTLANECTPTAKPVSSRVPPSARTIATDETLQTEVQANPRSADVVSIPRPTIPTPESGRTPAPASTSRVDIQPAFVEKPPLPRDWRDVITRAVAPVDIQPPNLPLDYDENSSMLPPMKPVGNAAPIPTHMFSTKHLEKEGLISNSPAADLHVREMHLSSQPPFIPETVLPKKEDLVWQVMKTPRPVMPTAPQEVEKTGPAWSSSPWLDKTPASAPSLPTESVSQTSESKRPALFQGGSSEHWGDRMDERLAPEQTPGFASSSTHVDPHPSSYERVVNANRRERSLRHNKGKDVERIDDISDNYNQDSTTSALPPVPVSKPGLRPSTQAPLEANSYHPTSPDVTSNRPISPPPRFQSLESKSVFSEKPPALPFSLQNHYDVEDGMLSGMSSPTVSPRPASPLPLPPQVHTQTKPSRPPKPYAQGSSKRHHQQEEIRPPTPPLPSHYKKKRSYDVLPTDQSNFLKPATHLLYPDTSSDCHSLMPNGNASRPRLGSQSQLRYESSLDTAGLQSKSARNLHSPRYNDKEIRNRRRTPYYPTSDTQDDPQSGSDGESESETNPLSQSSESSHGEHRSRHVDDPYTDVTIERATRGYHSKPVGRAKGHTLTLPPSPTAKERRTRRRRSRSPTSSSGRSRSGHRPRQTGRSQNEKVTRDRGVSPVGRPRGGSSASNQQQRPRGFWRSFGFWAIRFFTRFKTWGSASAPNSPVTPPRRRRDYDSDFY